MPEYTELQINRDRDRKAFEREAREFGSRAVSHAKSGNVGRAREDARTAAEAFNMRLTGVKFGL